MRPSWVGALFLGGCFHATPVVPAPATPAEQTAIASGLDGTVWYVHTYAEAGGEPKGAIEVFVFIAGGDLGPVAFTGVYDGVLPMFEIQQRWLVETSGKNVILHYAAMAASTRSLRIDRIGPDRATFFDYDFSRTYELGRTTSGQSVTAPVGDYVWLRLAPLADDAKQYGQDSGVSCTLEPPPAGKALFGKCAYANEEPWPIQCAEGDRSQPLACSFGGPKAAAATLRLGPDGSLAGVWSAGGRTMPLALIRHR